MKIFLKLALIFVFSATGNEIWASDIDAVKSVEIAQVFKIPGIYKPVTGACPISLGTSEMGGSTTLSFQVKSKNNKIIYDITGIAYLSNDRLAYTVSPIYGRPGVFVYDCNTGKINRVIGPQKINKFYPHGADYFELYGIKSKKIVFYYSNDIEKTDFNQFRTSNALREVKIPNKK